MFVLLLQLHSYTIISNSEKRFQINGRKIKINRWPQTKYRIHRLAFTVIYIYLIALVDTLLLWNSPFKTDSNRDTFSLGRILSIHFSLFSNETRQYLKRPNKWCVFNSILLSFFKLLIGLYWRIHEEFVKLILVLIIISHIQNQWSIGHHQ